MSDRAAAFFDLDGTLMPLPSLEQRFFRMLRRRGEIAPENYLSWFCEALKLASRGINIVVHGNKMYLRGVRSFEGSREENQIDSLAHKSGHQDEGQASAPPRRFPRSPVPHFFAEGLERVAWHGMQGHAIVIVSGTLKPLASAAARAMEAKLAERGIVAGVRVRATNLEESEGRWTGRILGEAMFGKAKAPAVLALAEEMGLDLSQSWAYGDSGQDRWMLAVVGNPVAMNPSARLARIAKKRGWTLLRWGAKENPTDSSQRAQRSGSMRDEVQKNESALQEAERCA